jgi:hypothetical protein
VQGGEVPFAFHFISYATQGQPLLLATAAAGWPYTAGWAVCPACTACCLLPALCTSTAKAKGGKCSNKTHSLCCRTKKAREEKVSKKLAYELLPYDIRDK